MKLLVTVQHPAHVHFFRPVVEELRADGHRASIYVREKDVATDLLDACGLDHEVLVGSADTLPGLATVQARWEWRLLRAARREEPDVLTGIGGLAAAHVGAALGIESVVFTDTETPANRLAAPFADAICTPKAFGQSLGGSHRRYDGFQELAYLHPDRFEADPGALRAAGVEPDEFFAVCRFSGMDAHHDVGRDGLPAAARRELLADLAERGPVYISVESEGAADGDGTGDEGVGDEGADDDGAGTGDEPDLPPGVEDLPVPPHRLHDLLAAADLVVTDAATTATEAGLLGTPTVRVGAYGPDHLRNFVELERRGLVRSTPDPGTALALARDLADDPDAEATWRERRERVVAESVDVAGYAADVLAAAGSSSDPATAAARQRSGGSEAAAAARWSGDPTSVRAAPATTEDVEDAAPTVEDAEDAAPATTEDAGNASPAADDGGQMTADDRVEVSTRE